MTIAFTKQNKNRVYKALQRDLSFKKLTTEELHQFVQNYNFDDGLEPFEWIVKQKHCDKGTALCLYWHLEPDFHCEKNRRDASNQDIELIKEIENRFLTGFYENEQFAFNPKTEFLTPIKNTSCLPKEMLEKTNGIPFEKLSVEFAFLRTPNEKEFTIIQKKIKNAIDIIQISNPDFVYENPDHAVKNIIDSVEYWKVNDLGKIKIYDLSYLWLDCIHKKYDWDWIMWDWETGANYGVSNKSKKHTCLADTIIRHTIDNFEPTNTIYNLFRDLNSLKDESDHLKYHYTGIGLLFSSSHLTWREL